MPEFKKGNSEDLSYTNIPPSQEKNKAKKTFALVGVIGVLALFLGFMKLIQNIEGPFTPVVTLTNSTLTNEQLGQINSLKTEDTDLDGLSDYDELYFYNTSPYLKDSDSDGFSDQEEIETNNDPNCPAGEDCVGATLTNTNTAAANTNISANISLTNTNSALLSGDVTAGTLRETLKNAGVPQYILDNTDDETLLEVYNQTIQETQATNANTNADTNLSVNTNLSLNTNASEEEVYGILYNLSAQEIRELLIEYGLDEAELNQVDDETLRAIFLKALEEESIE